jgi:Reverse transcriptase (RNA-dependent DNA polymerase)/RNase H-like domain found in reverse transcriptase/Integrase zinc binding domain/Chromo (CHRromatin Organisation MOdifier) domain/Retrotransposon gag protein
LLHLPLFFQLRLLHTRTPLLKVTQITQNTVKIASTRANPPDQFFTADQLPTRRKPTPTQAQLLQPPTQAITEDTSDSETLSRPRTPPDEPSGERINEPQTRIIAQPMATAKPMKPSAFNGKIRDAQTVETWLIRMTTYLKLTKTVEGDKVELASSYLDGDALDWFIGNQTTLLAGTFDGFKTSLRDHFVPQNHKSVAYGQYKTFKQGNLSVSEYSIKIKALADQIPDLVPTSTRDLDFVNGLFHDIKKLIVSQPSVKDETWNALVGRALRIEETLPAGYQLTPNRALPSTPSGPRRGPPQFTRSDRSSNSNRPSNSDRSSNWRQKLTTSTPSAPAPPAPAPLEPLSDSDRTFLIKHNGCFRCRKTFVNHTSRTCGLDEKGAATVENSGLAKEVKQEVNFVSETEAEYQFEDSDQCQVVPPIVLPIQLNDQIVAEGLIDCGSTSDFISQTLVNRNSTTLRPRPTLSPSLLHNALTTKPVRVNEELLTKLQFQSPVKAKVKSPTLLKVAPLVTHDVILGMPFLKQNDLLVDPVARTVLPRKQSPRKQSPPVVERDHYVKVGNALMLVPENTVRTLSHHATKEGRAPPKVVTRCYTVRLACCAIAMEDTRYKELHTAFTKQYSDVFSKELPSKLPPDGGPRHRIILKDDRPINGKLIRVPTKYWPAMKRFIDTNLKAKRIRPSSSHISAGTLMTPKKDLTVDPRVVHDYRELNERTVKDHTPLPRQDEILELLVRAVVRGKIDLVSAYYQILMHPDDIHKTAFKTPFGLYEWLVMPQGLCNAPATFQRHMNYVLREYIGKFCAVYQDDIAIFSNSVEEHKQHIHLILQALRNHGITASPEKSTLFADRIEFLGHYVSSKGLEADPNKLEKIANWPTPITATQITEFNGLVNYLATFDFVPGLAEQSAILTDLTKKGVEFRWEKKHDDAFKMIKKLAKSVQFLQRINYESGEPVWLISDASNRGVGGYVAQGPDWKTARPIGFYSRQYRPAEVNYPTHEQEMLAIISCMKHWYPQLTGTHFTVLSDHAPLQYWRTQRDLSKRQIRWLDFLSDFDFDIKYIPGITNKAADALSRYPFAQVNAITMSTTDPKIRDEIRKSYSEDSFFKPIVENPKQYPLYIIQDNGLIYLHDGRLCIPNSKSTRELLLHQHHDNENHFGIGKSYQALSTRYFWPGLSKDVRKYTASCSQCLRNKSSNQVPAGLLHPLPVPHERFSDIAMDFVGPFPRSDGYDMILVTTDRLTNYVRIEPTHSTATAPDIASLVYNTWCRQFGLPQRIVSDRDKLFMSQFWKALHKLLGIEIQASTSYHPQTDGSSERSNKTVIQALRNYVNRRQTDWTKHLVHVETAMNNSVNATTELAPTELLYGSPIRLFPTLSGTNINDIQLPDVKQYVDRITESISIAKDNHITAKTIQTRNANKSRRPDPIYRVGDMVMLDSRNIRRRIKKNGRSAKLYPRFLGPFKIIRAEPETSNYKLELLPKVDFTSIHPNFHSSLLRPYHPNDPEQFPKREPPRPGPVIPDDPEGAQYTVEKLIDHRPQRNPRQYLVRWEGWDESHDQWVAKKDIHRDLIREYHNGITS